MFHALNFRVLLSWFVFVIIRFEFAGSILYWDLPMSFREQRFWKIVKIKCSMLLYFPIIKWFRSSLVQCIILPHMSQYFKSLYTQCIFYIYPTNHPTATHITVLQITVYTMHILYLSNHPPYCHTHHINSWKSLYTQCIIYIHPPYLPLLTDTRRI